MDRRQFIDLELRCEVARCHGPVRRIELRQSSLTQPLYEAELKARGLHLPPSPTPRPQTNKRLTSTKRTATARNRLPQHPFEIVNGYFVVDGKVAYGASQNDAWWHGNTSPAVSGALTGSSITRFMPGQTAPGLTEDLNELVARAKQHGAAFYQTIPGLWYEHRRDEHTVTRQPNGDVWAPFFEMPWARSGKGIAWDGLSRFDLSRYNPWYFERNREFARSQASRESSSITISTTRMTSSRLVHTGSTIPGALPTTSTTPACPSPRHSRAATPSPWTPSSPPSPS